MCIDKKQSYIKKKINQATILLNALLKNVFVFKKKSAFQNIYLYTQTRKKLEGVFSKVFNKQKLTHKRFLGTSFQQ